MSLSQSDWESNKALPACQGETQQALQIEGLLWFGEPVIATHPLTVDRRPKRAAGIRYVLTSWRLGVEIRVYKDERLRPAQRESSTNRQLDMYTAKLYSFTVNMRY